MAETPGVGSTAGVADGLFRAGGCVDGVVCHANQPVSGTGGSRKHTVGSAELNASAPFNSPSSRDSSEVLLLG